VSESTNPNSEKSSNDNTKANTPGQKMPALDNRELKKSGFWLNQMFIVVSTVVGVFLAAQSGLEQALKFDNYSKKEDNYYLRSSLADELEDNIKQLQDYTANVLLKSQSLQMIKNNRPEVDLYIWEAMKYNRATLETPTSLLSGVRRFYSQSRQLMNKAEQRALSSRVAGERLQLEIDKVKQQTLPGLRNTAETLKAELATQGIMIGGLRDNVE